MANKMFISADRKRKRTCHQMTAQIRGRRHPKRGSSGPSLSPFLPLSHAIPLSLPLSFICMCPRCDRLINNLQRANGIQQIVKHNKHNNKKLKCNQLLLQIKATPLDKLTTKAFKQRRRSRCEIK